MYVYLFVDQPWACKGNNDDGFSRPTCAAKFKKYSMTLTVHHLTKRVLLSAHFEIVLFYIVIEIFKDGIKIFNTLWSFFLKLNLLRNVHICNSNLIDLYLFISYRHRIIMEHKIVSDARFMSWLCMMSMHMRLMGMMVTMMCSCGHTHCLLQKQNLWCKYF